MQVPQLIWSDHEGNASSKGIDDEKEDLAADAMPASNLRMYWMPDRLCKVCHECELPFTMFRRRHHCRVCGQVFCQPCSNNHIDGKVCDVCGYADLTVEVTVCKSHCKKVF